MKIKCKVLLWEYDHFIEEYCWGEEWEERELTITQDGIILTPKTNKIISHEDHFYLENIRFYNDEDLEKIEKYLSIKDIIE
jgi:hypothetical protein